METNKIKFGYSIKENLLKLSLNNTGNDLETESSIEISIKE